MTKRFGRRLAVDRLTLTVPAGEIFGLLGHNGAGKSTAIGMMLGQVWPTAGKVLVRSQDVMSHRGRALERVGAIFETPAFYDYLSGWSNLVILASYTARTSSRRIKEVIDWVGLTGREHTAVRTYSHGMRARLALAQALLPQPELLLLDEPGEGLDPEGIHEMRQTILRLHRELGLTILLSSHLLNEVQQLCKRIAVIRQGRKVFEGAVSDACRSPRWYRLATGDSNGAIELLRSARLIANANGERLIELADGVGPDSVVRLLVKSGIAVYEITREEQTLEAFYLSLMRDDPQRADKNQSEAACSCGSKSGAT